MCHQYHSSVSKEYSQKAFNSLLNIFANTKDGAIIFIALKEKDRYRISYSSDPIYFGR